MTRLEAGAVAPNLAPQDVGEIVDTALRRRGDDPGRPPRSTVDLAPDLPLLAPRPGPVRAGPGQPPRQRRQVRAGGLDRHASRAAQRRARSCCRCSTRATACPRRISSGCSTSSTASGRATASGPAPGSGLAIARGFVEAMGGTLTAGNRRRPPRRRLHRHAAGSGPPAPPRASPHDARLPLGAGAAGPVAQCAPPVSTSLNRNTAAITQTTGFTSRARPASSFSAA